MTKKTKTRSMSNLCGKYARETKVWEQLGLEERIEKLALAIEQLYRELDGDCSSALIVYNDFYALTKRRKEKQDDNR